jgi:hypothetical protein
MNERCFRFFQITFSNGLERFQLKLNAKAKEAFEQIHQAVQERLENDQIKVSLIRLNKSSMEFI